MQGTLSPHSVSSTCYGSHCCMQLAVGVYKTTMKQTLC